MNIQKKIAIFTLVGIFFLSTGFYGFKKKSLLPKVLQTNLIEVLHKEVLDTIKYAEDIPGLKSEEFHGLKEEIADTWNILVEDKAIEIISTDSKIRPCFVTLQAIMEHVLSTQLQREIKSLKGLIHTPMPTTPLCTQGKISAELIDPTIANDPMRLFTVKARTTILRDYLFKGGNLYIIYPKDGFNKRSENQRLIYIQELKNYPKHLFDTPLECESMPAELVGATYIFQDKGGKSFVFSIKITQANNPQEYGKYGLWFGPLNHPLIQERVREVSSYLQENGSSLLKNETR